MSPSPYPLKERLHVTVTERALQRVWRGIDERTPERPRRKIRRSALAALVGLALMAGLGIGLMLRARAAILRLDRVEVTTPQTAP